jgi:hypothetical protein
MASGVGDRFVAPVGLRLPGVIGEPRPLEVILRPGDAQRARVHQTVGGEDQALGRQRRNRETDGDGAESARPSELRDRHRGRDAEAFDCGDGADDAGVPDPAAVLGRNRHRCGGADRDHADLDEDGHNAEEH